MRDSSSATSYFAGTRNVGGCRRRRRRLGSGGESAVPHGEKVGVFVLAVVTIGWFVIIAHVPAINCLVRLWALPFPNVAFLFAGARKVLVIYAIVDNIVFWVVISTTLPHGAKVGVFVLAVVTIGWSVIIAHVLATNCLVRLWTLPLPNVALLLAGATATIIGIIIDLISTI